MIGRSVADWDGVGRLVRDTRGATAAEYVLILAVVGGLLAMATLALSGSISGSMNEAAELIASRGASGGSPSPAAVSAPASVQSPALSAGAMGKGNGHSAGSPHNHGWKPHGH